MKCADSLRWSLIAVAALVWPAEMARAVEQAPPAQDLAVAAGNSSPAPQLRAMRATVDRRSVTLALEIAGEFNYVPTTSSGHLLLVDLPRVSSKEASTSHLLDSPLVSSYRAVGYLREGLPSARLEVLLKTPVSVDYRKTEGRLEVRLTPQETEPATAGLSSSPAPSPVAPSVPAGVPANSVANSARGDRVEKISLAKGPESAGAAATMNVHVHANGVLEYKAFELSNPRRLVLDIPNVVNRADKQPILAEGMSPLKVVRVGQFSQQPPVTRVVMELEDVARYDVRRSSSGLEIALHSIQAGTVRKSQPAIVARAPQALPEVPGLSSTLSSNMPASVDAVFASVRQLMAAPKVELAEGPQRPMELPSSASQPAPAAPPLFEPRPAVVAPVTTAASIAAHAVQAAAPAPAAQAPMAAPQATKPPTSAPGMGAPKRYSGELISINVKDVDLKDFFRLIHEISGLNVVLDMGVKGTLTMVLDDVPWDQALDIVLHNFQLDSAVEGNVLRIATLDTIKREQKDIADLAKAQQDTVERITVTRPINYAKAEDLAPVVKKFLSPRADVIADARTNQLIITDIPQSFPNMEEVLKQLDKATKQVEIEARVVSASRNFSRDFGSQIGFALKSGLTTILDGPGGTPPIAARPEILAPGVAAPAVAAKPAVPGPFFNGTTTGIHLAQFGALYALDLVLTAAEARGLAKVLSRPKIVTQNNRQGMIKQGVKIPLQTSVNNTISVQFVDVTLTLTVTPQITSDNNIFMLIDVTNSTLGSRDVNNIPAVNTQQATTQVMVADGETAVFGGIMQNLDSLTINQVPLLGSIPILGNLFKKTSVSNASQELLFFVTPKII